MQYQLLKFLALALTVHNIFSVWLTVQENRVYLADESETHT